MFTFYIENHESVGSLTKNCPKPDKNKSIVSRFSVSGGGGGEGGGGTLQLRL